MAKTAQIIARALKEEGVTHAFGIPGGEVLALLDAFRETGIEFVLTKQELGAGRVSSLRRLAPESRTLRRQSRTRCSIGLRLP
jgi:glyoxylate carboligase